MVHRVDALESERHDSLGNKRMQATRRTPTRGPISLPMAYGIATSETHSSDASFIRVEMEASMPELNQGTWPTAILAADDEAPDGRHVVLTVLSMSELARRLESLGPRVAASLNAVQVDRRPLVALEVKAGTAMPELFRSIDGSDMHFVQRGLTWCPGDSRYDGDADIYVLTQTLVMPRWVGAASYAIPPLTEHNTVYYVVTLPAQVIANEPIRLQIAPHSAEIVIPGEVLTNPPHPPLWWGTPPVPADPRDA